MSPRRGLAASLLASAAACSGAPAAPPQPPLISITSPSTESAPPTVPAQAHAPEKAGAAPEALAWAEDEAGARARARREGRPLLVYLRAGWSVGSLWMEREVWTDARVVAAARAFVALRLDLTGAEGDAELYAQRYGATRLPAVALFDVEGRRAALLLGAQEAEALRSALLAAAE